MTGGASNGRERDHGDTPASKVEGASNGRDRDHTENPASTVPVGIAPATTVRPEDSHEDPGPDALRRDRLFAAFANKGVPLRTILTIDAVVIVTWVLYRLIGRLREVILWILIAAFISLVLNPAVVALQRWRLKRVGAVAVVFVAAVLAFTGLLVLFGYPLINSLTHFAEQLPHMIRELKKGHGTLAHLLDRVHLLSWVQKNAPKIQTAAQNLGKPALSVGTNLGKAVFSTILALTTIGFLSLFMLIEAPAIRRGFLGSLAPKRRERVEQVATTVSKSVTSYVLGNIALSLIFGLVIFVTLVILGVPFALLLGLWVGLVAMIPLVGGLIAGVPTVAIALLHSPVSALVALIVFVTFQLIENHFLYPIVMSRTVRMNPLWVLLSVLVGANLGGVFGSALGALAGALVAIPVGGAIQVVFREVWHHTQASPAEDPGAPEGLDGGAKPEARLVRATDAPDPVP
ncbi:MAG TPA: AI-2E family transporter [Acidimicrobiales bacterium]|jgi:predicted PurR-regulated permease PerM|nr:AI-2E family transporter [Acidimicrobiales bacterium]